MGASPSTLVLCVPCALHDPQTVFKHALELLCPEISESYYDTNIITRGLRKGYHAVADNVDKYVATVEFHDPVWDRQSVRLLSSCKACGRFLFVCVHDRFVCA